MNRSRHRGRFSALRVMLFLSLSANVYLSFQWMAGELRFNVMDEAKAKPLKEQPDTMELESRRLQEAKERTTAIAPRSVFPFSGPWVVTKSDATESSEGERITITKDVIVVGGQPFNVLYWSSRPADETTTHTAQLIDGEKIHIIMSLEGDHASIGLKTGIVSVQREAVAEKAMLPNDFVNWLNRKITTVTIDGIRFDYHLSYVGDAKDMVETQFTMTVRNALEGRGLVGDGLAAYHEMVNRLIEPKRLVIQDSFVNGVPITDKASNTIIWQQAMGFGPMRH
jgi:hypothetical protein